MTVDKKDGKKPEDEKGKIAQDLFTEACKAYGIAPEYVLAKAVRGAGSEETVIIVTRGGAKVCYRSGDKVKRVSRVQITGTIEK